MSHPKNPAGSAENPQPMSDSTSPAPPPDRRSMLQNSLLAIERLQARVAAAEDAKHEPIAIVGMACRLPGDSNTPEAFWQLLSEGRDTVREVPPDRWDVEAYYDPRPEALGKARTKAGSFLNGVEQFDPAFFGMSPREARGLDPQQRLLLESCWEALEHAAIPADKLDGSLTGVFIGITSIDYSARVDVNDAARSDIYLATGTALNAAAGRISFTFDFRGPCMAIDTACSSSLVAIHTACQSLRNRESNLALAGGVNLMLSPDPFVLISKWGMLSPDGRCKTFDASANGFVRGEGCGVLVLERLSDALANQRRILAVIAGSAINQDGRSSGLTVPNGLAQQEVVRHALSAARLKPSDVSYVEAHGTGTSLGDPIEVEALAAVYGVGRSPDQPLEIASVKSNIGHLEAASGVTSLIKLTLALQHRQIPASLHVKQLTPAIPWHELPLRVSTSLHEWSPASGRRIAGVSAFGFSGMNAHLLVEQAPEAPARAAVGESERSLFLLPLSARSDAALKRLATLYAEHLQHHPEQALSDVCATAALGRSHLNLRAVALAPDRPSMIQQLAAIAEGQPGMVQNHVAASGRMRVAFLFTGQGAQYAGMGRALDAAEPVFRATLDRCAAVLDPLIGRPLRRVMFDEADRALDQTAFTQPALYALEVSLAALWRSFGIEPTVVLGHSVGEFAAAAVAGVFSIEDGARLIAARGRLMQALPAGGAMVSVQGDPELVRRECAAHSAQVSIAALNTPDTLVISGAGAVVSELSARLQAQGLRCQALPVSHAFHSPLMEPMVEDFRRIAAQVRHERPTSIWISNLSGEPLDWNRWGARMADYWATHARQAVEFQRSMSALRAAACDAHVEVGPGTTLLGMGKQCLPDAVDVDWLPSLRRKEPGVARLLDSAARLYARGMRLDWQALQSPSARRNLALPSYPFQRQAYLVPYARKAQPSVARPTAHDLLGQRLSMAGVIASFTRTVDASSPVWLHEHRIGSDVVMPLTAYLEAALSALRDAEGESVSALSEIELGEAMVVPDGQARVLQVIVDRPSLGAAARVRVFSRAAEHEDDAWTLHATASAASAVLEPRPERALGELAATLPNEIDAQEVYQRLSSVGIEFGPAFRSLKQARGGDGEAVGEIQPNAAVQLEGERYLIHPAVLDACIHVSAVASASLGGDDAGRLYLPVGVERYEWLARPTGELRVHAKLRPSLSGAESLLIDLRIDTLAGQPVARLRGLRARRVTRSLGRQRADGQVAHWLYELGWEAQVLAAAEGAAQRGTWLILDEGAGRGALLAQELARRGATVLRATLPGAAAPGEITLDPERSQDYQTALALAAQSGPLAGVVSLWPLALPRLGLDTVPSAEQRLGTTAALLLLQAVLAEAAENAPRLWFVTAASQVVDGTEVIRLEQAAVAGLARAAAAEHAELRVTHLDLDPEEAPSEASLLLDELLGNSEELQVALRKGSRFVARLRRRPRERAPYVDDAPTRLDISERGTLQNLALVPMQRRAPGPGEIELRVRASGLNFRDVLNALGLYPGLIRHIGSDCAGEVTRIGEGVTQFAVGDRVVAMAEGAIASHATTRWEFAAPLPARLSFEQGAAIPTAYLTADITLNLIAGMKRGSKVLIHAGAGGVGMAAIALANRVGAEIFATAGSPAKRAVLGQLGVQHTLDSRSTSFADEVLRITNGRGVDIVLNSLAGPMLDRSFDCVAEGGFFIEIGKRDLWSAERVAALGRGIRYHVVDATDNARDTPEVVGRIFSRVLQDIDSGSLPILPCRSFNYERAAEAFRYMAQAKHTGRVVLRHAVAPRPIEAPIRAEATYLITGGLRGLGLRVAEWLVQEGARSLLLVGRHEPDEVARAILSRLEAQGARLSIVSADVSSADDVERIVQRLASELPALGGVIHCAAVLDDGALLKQSPERFANVMRPKADGAWRLSTALARSGLKPEFFVLFSSFSAVLGSPGQSNYVAANAFLDALAHYLRGLDLPATSINWGAWAEEGMAARGGTVARAAARGVNALALAEGLSALGVLLRENPTQVSVVPFDWNVVTLQLQGAPPPPALRSLVAEASRRAYGSTDQASVTLRDFAALSPEVRSVELAVLVRRELSTVLALDTGAAIDADQPFTHLGLDSLTAVELRNRIQSALGRPVPAVAALDWPTVAQMVLNLNALFAEGAISAPSDDAAKREEFTL